MSAPHNYFIVYNIQKMLILYVLLHNKITQQKLHNKTNNTIAETVIYNEFCYEFVYSIFFSNYLFRFFVFVFSFFIWFLLIFLYFLLFFSSWHVFNIWFCNYMTYDTFCTILSVIKIIKVYQASIIERKWNMKTKGVKKNICLRSGSARRGPDTKPLVFGCLPGNLQTRPDL